MPKNIELFNYSLTKPEQLLEDTYKKGQLVITTSKEEKNELIQRNEKLIELITTYKTMNGRLTAGQESDLINEIIDLIFNTQEQMNYTAFSQYLMVCDLSYSLLMSEPIESKRKIIKDVLKEYIKDRHSIYLSHGYSNIVLQVMSDNYSHKRNSNSGTGKAETQIVRRGVTKFRKGMAYDQNFYLLVDSETKDFIKILAAKKINFEWSSSKQKKVPDVLINYNGKTYIIEHKHMKEGGGGQSKQDTEIVDFIKYSEEGASFITYLDGPYFNNHIAVSSGSKEVALKSDILDQLAKNKNNYFLNTAGFERFLDEVVIGHS